MNYKKTRKLILCLSILLTGYGCASAILKELDYPRYRIATEPSLEEITVSSIEEDKIHTRSIGQNLFSYIKQKKLFSTEEVIGPKSPYRSEFPEPENWKGTHLYSLDSLEFIVYSSEQYYNGNMGVILNEDGELALDSSMIYLVGPRRGLRDQFGRVEERFFQLKTTEKTKTLIDPWALRFSGMLNDIYTFEVINQLDPTVIEVLQVIKVSEADFMGGVTIRNILLQGVQPYTAGIIRFKLTDLSRENAAET